MGSIIFIDQITNATQLASRLPGSLFKRVAQPCNVIQPFRARFTNNGSPLTTKDIINKVNTITTSITNRRQLNSNTLAKLFGGFNKRKQQLVLLFIFDMVIFWFWYIFFFRF